MSPLSTLPHLRALLGSDLVSPPTRRVLEARLADAAPVFPRFLSDQQEATLRAVCARLIPQPDRPAPLDLALSLHQRWACEAGKGWRYDNLPPDKELYRRGLAGLDELAQARQSMAFAALPETEQDAVLAGIAAGDAHTGEWATLPAARFFEELLAAAVECYYTHPVAQAEIGYVGFADAAGWHQIGLNEQEVWQEQKQHG